MINSKMSGWPIIFEIKPYDLSLSYFESISLVKIREYNKDCYFAPACHCKVWFRFQNNSIIRGLTKHQWFVALKFMTLAHKYSFHMVITIGVFRRGFKGILCVSANFCAKSVGTWMALLKSHLFPTRIRGMSLASKCCLHSSIQDGRLWKLAMLVISYTKTTACTFL